MALSPVGSGLGFCFFMVRDYFVSQVLFENGKVLVMCTYTQNA